jgi:hypothetical protein
LSQASEIAPAKLNLASRIVGEKKKTRKPRRTSAAQGETEKA